MSMDSEKKDDGERLVNESDRKFVEEQLQTDKILPYQKNALLDAITLRRNLVESLRGANIGSLDEISNKNIRDGIDVLEKFEDVVDTSANIADRTEDLKTRVVTTERKINQDNVEAWLRDMARVGYILLYDKFNYLFPEKEGKGKPQSYEVLDMFSDATKEIYRVMNIASQRVPLFPQQVVDRIQLNPEVNTEDRPKKHI